MTIEIRELIIKAKIHGTGQDEHQIMQQGKPPQLNDKFKKIITESVIEKLRERGWVHR